MAWTHKRAAIAGSGAMVLLNCRLGRRLQPSTTSLLALAHGLRLPDWLYPRAREAPYAQQLGS